MWTCTARRIEKTLISSAERNGPKKGKAEGRAEGRSEVKVEGEKQKHLKSLVT
ncbi:hypothetical protein K220099C10_49810 [Bacteroides thetaiotaomicron]